MPSDGGAYFLTRSCHVNGTNMRGKAGYQIQGSSGIALIQDDIQRLHTSPITAPLLQWSQLFRRWARLHRR